MTSAVYLDYNATAPLRREALEAMVDTLQAVGNPSSVHAYGRRARERVEQARDAVASLVGARPAQVVFTSGGTEANHLAIRGGGQSRVLYSAIEHDSVVAAASGGTVVPVTADGVIDLAALERELDKADAPALVSVMLANNETGAIQPVAEVVSMAHARGAMVHCDAVQAAGKMALDVPALGVDLMTLSAHKLGGPQGAGALIVSDAVALTPLQGGGGQERGRRAGTESVAALVGFGTAAGLAARELGRFERLAEMRDDMEARVVAAAPQTVVFARDTARLANTSCLAMPGVAAATMVMAMDLAGIAISAGAACSSGKVRPSHVLSAMGVDETMAGSAVRVSLGLQTRDADVDRFVGEWTRLYGRLAAA
jgi:cysteine desulfurase